MKIKIISCKNIYFWYNLESQKPMKDINPKKEKKIFETVNCLDACNDKLGVIIPAKGFVYHSDYIIID